MSYLCKTTKKLCTSRVILRKKGGGEKDDGDGAGDEKGVEGQEGGAAMDQR